MIEWLKRKLPSQEDFQNDPKLKRLHRFLHHPDYWHLHCHAVAKAVGVGLFINFLPIPFQMFFAALFAIIIKANIPISVALTWINNPFTFIPINIFMYKVGSFLIENELVVKNPPLWNFHTNDLLEFSEQFMSWILTYGKAYGIGVIIVSISASSFGYLITLAVWKGVYCIKNYIKKNSSEDKSSVL